jgi:Protein of unknown function (DUF3572)
MTRRPKIIREEAESLAIQGLSFLAADGVRLDRFLALTGIRPESLRDAASEPLFLLGVLDHLANDERLLIEFATLNQIEPEAVTEAHALLAGPHPPQAMT